jgi:hypothetical protein
MTVEASPLADRRESASKLWRRAALVVGLLVVTGVVVVVGWTWRHPNVLQPYGNGMGRTGVKPGSTVYATVADPVQYKGGVVTIRGVTPHNLRDSTRATLTYYLCAVKPGSLIEGIYYRREMEPSCARLVPALGARMSLSGQELLVAITPHRSGVLVFHGADVHYSRGWQDGTQRTGFDTRIRVE